MGATALLADLDKFFFKDGIPHAFSPHSLYEQEEREEASLSHSSEAPSLCTLEFITGALDKFRPFTGREVTAQTVSIQENNSGSHHTTVQISRASSFNALVHCKPHQLQLGLCPDTHYQK